MSTGYNPAGWTDLFVASAGATAALSGLIFVGLSVTLPLAARSSREPYLRLRAVEGLLALVIVLAISLAALTPNASRYVLAVVVLAAGVVSAVSPWWVWRRHTHNDSSTIIRVVMAVVFTVLLLGAAVTLLAGQGGGLYWLPAAFVLAISIAAYNAWVLLDEVMRHDH